MVTKAALLMLVLGGCAATTSQPAIRTARAFADLCTPLEMNGIAARAAEYAFVYVEPKARNVSLPGTTRRQGVHNWTRADGVVRATLSWNDSARICELALGGLDAADAEAAFDSLVASFAQGGREATPLPVPKPRANSLALRRTVVVGPPSLAPGAIRVLSIRTDDRPGRPVQAVLSMRVAGVDRPTGDDATPIE